MYDPKLVQPMREELTRLGIKELRTATDVDSFVSGGSGTALVVVNSVCGCAAGGARPGVKMALQHKTRPERLATVFAGQDKEATDRARSHFKGYPPSSPSVALIKNGECIFMLERHDIEGRTPEQIASSLTAAFDKYCA